jgi:hypothetical protein
MILPSPLLILRAGLLVAIVATSTVAAAQESSADRDDATLAYAQCMRDNGFTEFADPTPDGDLRIQVTPESEPRFRAAAAACRDLAPAGFRDEGVTPEELEILLKLSQCVRANGVPDFPDPDSGGRFDLSGTSVASDEKRLEAAMGTCRSKGGFPADVQIIIGG